jgi:hypothetical protein
MKFGPDYRVGGWIEQEGHAMPAALRRWRMLARSSQEESAPFSAVRKIIMMK